MSDATVLGKDRLLIQAMIRPDLINVFEDFWLGFRARKTCVLYGRHLTDESVN